MLVVVHRALEVMPLHHTNIILLFRESQAHQEDLACRDYPDELLQDQR